ncbi:MAG: hypothetical protein ACFFBP_05890 [Promethearchaeota archaeon]
MSNQVQLPIYSQMHNTCGISTFLMLINPKQNKNFKRFLNDLYEKINYLMRHNRKEFKWSIAVDYLLLKSMGFNIIRDYIYEKNHDLVDYYMPIVHYKLGDKQFSENNKISKRILKNSLHTMREDPDLKILFYLFGGNFYPQEQEIWDGTGALYFSSKDFTSSVLNYKTKLKILQDHLKTEKEGAIPCIALNYGFHWVAINSIKNDTLEIHNSLSSVPYSMKINKRIHETYRFYLFSYNEKDAFILTEEVKEFLNIDR